MLKNNLTKIVKTKDKLYGFCTVSGDRYINIELIWDTYPNTNNFIKKFSTTLLHERLHSIIDDIIIGKIYHYKKITQKNYRLGVERVIRRLTGEQWSKIEQEDYQ